MDIDNIQPAMATDSEELSELAFQSKGYWGYSDDFMAVSREVLRVSPQMIEEQPCYVYVDATGMIQGFYLLEKCQKTCDLDMLFVLPEAIGKGVGRQLIQHALVKASEMGCERLIVTSDPQALPFYVRVGGTQIGYEESEVVTGRMLPQLEFLL